jgi:hypothetical protein
MTITSGVHIPQLTEFAQKNHLRLPEDYRDFLVRFDGGAPHPKASWVATLKDYVLVDYLFGITRSRPLNLQFWLDEYRDEMPPGFLIVGKDPGGAFFILDAGEAQTGVYLWDHQHRYPGSSEEDGNTFLLAGAFSTWINSLCELPDANTDKA